jgi:sulfate transport system permease protein
MRTEITPLLIVTKLQEYDYTGATAIAVAMLVVSFALLLPINLLQRWAGSRREHQPVDDAPLGASLKPVYGQEGSQ